MNRSAVISDCGVYRYRLSRWWDEGFRAVFVMLNPSTADAEQDDPTIRRCIGFAKAWKCAGLEVVNLFALRSTDPMALTTYPDPIGPENDKAIRDAIHAPSVVVAAWGVHGRLRGRGVQVRALVGNSLYCLGLTRSGHPRHPLYVKADTKPMPYGAAVPQPG